MQYSAKFTKMRKEYLFILKCDTKFKFSPELEQNKYEHDQLK